MNRPTLTGTWRFESEDYAREELGAEIAPRMTGEKLGVGHKPRHGTGHVSSRIEGLESDPREVRAAAVDAQRMSDWLLARERDRTVEEMSSIGTVLTPAERRGTPSREGSLDRGYGALAQPDAGGVVPGPSGDARGADAG